MRIFTKRKRSFLGQEMETWREERKEFSLGSIKNPKEDIAMIQFGVIDE